MNARPDFSLEDYRRRIADVHSRTRRAPTQAEKDRDRAALQRAITPVVVRVAAIAPPVVETPAPPVRRRRRAPKPGNAVQAYINARCEELGVSYDDVTDAGQRRRAITGPRQEIMYEIRKEFVPTPSYSEIGRMFGGMDHSTVVHAVRQVSNRLGIERPPAPHTQLEMLDRDPERAERIRADFEAGKSLRVIGGAHGLRKEVISLFVEIRGWTRPLSRGLKAPTVPDAKAERIREMYYAGMLLKEISALTGVPIRSITTLRHRYGWPQRAKEKA